MSVVVVALFAAVVGAAPASPATEVGGGDPLFTRVEPHIAAGVRALEAEDPDLALERFRRAETSTDEQRAIVEYNAGQALLFQAMKKAEAEAAAQPAQPSPPTTTPPPGQPAPAQQPTPPDVVDALAAFERAASLGKNPSFISEARLAAGNAALVGSKLDDAIAQLRKALVAEPGNERARRNLQRALQLKQQQPPQQQDGGGDGDSDDNKDGEQKKDGEQEKKDGEQQGQQDDKGEEQKQGDKGDKNDEQKDDADKDGDGKKDEPEPKDGEEKADQQDGDGKKGDDGKDGETPAPAPAPKKPTSKEEARRLLEGIRSRERPLSPIEMRGTERRPADNGKDW